VFTVEEAKALRGDLPGHHLKNLFLRNKKEQMLSLPQILSRESPDCQSAKLTHHLS
jgi:hypothetical protein